MLNRRTQIFLFGASLGMSLLLGPQSGLNAEELKTDIEKASYAIGLKYGQGIRRDLGELKIDQILSGFRAGFNGDKPLMSEQEVTRVLTDFQNQQFANRKKAMSDKAEKNVAEGKVFMEGNAKRSGVKTTGSGLQYEILKAGSGAPPGPNDRVSVHYEGSLIDGPVFDSSRQRRKPAEFGVNAVIRGWTEALQLMKPGARWKLYIPPKLAYGERGTGGSIGPNETLIFDVELLKVDRR